MNEEKGYSPGTGEKIGRKAGKSRVRPEIRGVRREGPGKRAGQAAKAGKQEKGSRTVREKKTPGAGEDPEKGV